MKMGDDVWMRHGVRNTPGRLSVGVGRGTSCPLLGDADLLNRLLERQGETGLAGRITERSFRHGEELAE